MNLASNPTCTACSMHESALHNRCIGTRPYDGSSHERALLIIGEAPGTNEDAQNKCFVGPTGKILSEIYLDATTLPSMAKIYLTNAIRCRMPRESKPNSGHLKSCRTYLEHDIAEIATHHTDLTILCIGGVATQALLKKTLGKALAHQGRPLPDTPHRVFTTYHPAFLMPGRNPSAIHSVADHLQVMINYLKGQFTPLSAAPSVIKPYKTRMKSEVLDLDLDIETYGALAHHPQHYFHPHKSVTHDGIHRDDLIKTVAITHADKTFTLLWRDSHDKKLLTMWMRKLAASHGYLHGMNTVFDVLYLRYAYPYLKRYLRYGSIHLSDLAIWSYLHNEIRPEKSLKSLAPLFGITTYEGRSLNYTSDTDPELHAYNAQDTWATQQTREHLQRRIASDYGTDTPKLSPASQEWYSDLLWLLIHMTERGVYFDETKLKALATTCKDRIAEVQRSAWGKLSGTGSQLHIDHCLEMVSMDIAAQNKESDDQFDRDNWGGVHAEIPPLETTGITKRISSSEHNRNIIAAHSTHYARHEIARLGELRKAAKIVNTYTRPLLVGRKVRKRIDKNATLIDGIMYPSWYAVPSITNDESEEGGGTNQGRITCKLLQTAPKVVKHCYASRYGTRGTIALADLSQIELRVAALLSGCPALMQVYIDGLDLHTVTTQAIFGDHITDHSNFSYYRHIGKTVNFLILYHGGALKLQETLQRDAGIDYPIEDCFAAIDAHRSRFPGVMAWQERLIETVRQDGYLELPLTGQSRRFAGGDESIERWTSTICNFPVQCTAANILTSAQVAIMGDIELKGYRTINMCMQTYDSILLDYPTLLQSKVDQLLTHMECPPYYARLCTDLGRTVPLTYALEAL